MILRSTRDKIRQRKHWYVLSGPENPSLFIVRIHFVTPCCSSLWEHRPPFAKRSVTGFRLHFFKEDGKRNGRVFKKSCAFSTIPADWGLPCFQSPAECPALGRKNCPATSCQKSVEGLEGGPVIFANAIPHNSRAHTSPCPAEKVNHGQEATKYDAGTHCGRRRTSMVTVVASFPSTCCRQACNWANRALSRSNTIKHLHLFTGCVQ